MAKHVSQPTPRPTAKVLAAWVTGGGSIFVLGMLAAVTESVPADTFWGGLVAYIVTGAAGYIKKARTSEV